MRWKKALEKRWVFDLEGRGMYPSFTSPIEGDKSKSFSSMHDPIG